MEFLIAILVSGALFGGFILLTTIEMRRGARVAEGARTFLDKRVSRFAAISRHIDFGGFALHLVRTVFDHIAHDIAHVTLIAVRALERSLTGIVRQLRGRRRASTEHPEYSKVVQYMKNTKKEESEDSPEK